MKFNKIINFEFNLFSSYLFIELLKNIFIVNVTCKDDRQPGL